MFRARRLFFKALLAFLAFPGVFGILIPIALGYSDPWRGTGYYFGAIVILIGLIVLIWCVRDFYVFGKGTLAPWSPPKKLVIVGLYRYTRNPMYIGVLFIVSGISFFMGSPIVALYCVVMAIVFHLRVIWNEEPWLSAQFGKDWSNYKKSVSRWLPNLQKENNPYSSTHKRGRNHPFIY